VNAVFEETLFRGLLQNGLKTHLSPNRAILGSALIFGLWHAFWPLVNWTVSEGVITQIVVMVISTSILGILFGVYYERFSSGRSLTGPIVAHTLLNFISEGFKLGPEPTIQGPDLIFSNPMVMTISFSLFFIIFTVLLTVSWRYRLEDVEALWHRKLNRFVRNPSSRGIQLGKDIVLES
jgi:membrane protease YdiL (CAAX protease family)